MKIRPLHDRVLVRKAREAEKNPGGKLYLPEVAQQGNQQGLVIAVGEGRSFDGPGEIHSLSMVAYNVAVGQETPDQEAKRRAIEDAANRVQVYYRQKPIVRVGDVVLFGKFSGTVVEHDGEEVFILREDEVIAVDEEPSQELLERCQKPEAVVAN